MGCGCRVIEIALYIDGGFGEDVLRGGKDVIEEGFRNDAERDFAVDAAEGEVVDFVAEGRNVGALGGVDLNGEDVIAGGVEDRRSRQLEGERGVAAFVFAELLAVEVDGGGGHDAFEVDENALAHGGLGQLEVAAISGDEGVVLLREAVPRQLDVGVRDDDAVEGCVVEGARGGLLFGGAAVEPAAIHGESRSAASGGLLFSGKSTRRQRCSGDQSARGLDEVSTIHEISPNVLQHTCKELTVPDNGGAGRTGKSACGGAGRTGKSACGGAGRTGEGACGASSCVRSVVAHAWRCVGTSRIRRRQHA